jgi:hypothetical protein
MNRLAPACLRGLPSSVLALCLAAMLGATPARAGGLHAQFGVGLNGLLGLGDLGKVSGPCPGGDAALQIVHEGGGFGGRVAGGVHLLRGHSIPTGTVIFNGTGTQDGTFEARQSIWWIAIGPSWTRPLWGGDLASHVMAGRAIAKASSGIGWTDQQGSDPGVTTVGLVRGGASWAPRGGHVEVGTELLVGGRAAFWDDPPVTTDGTGTHVLRSRSATIAGVVFRLGYRLKA